MDISLNGIKTKAYLIIVSAFVLGTVTGVLLMNLVAARSAATKQPPSPMEELFNELQLEQKQREQINKILQDSRQRSREIQKTIQPQLDELRVRTRSEVKSLLLPHQQTRYEALLRKKDALREQKEKVDK